MIKILKRVIKHSIIYGSGSLLSKLLGFILLPMYTRFLTPADYGILSLLVITGSISEIIGKLGIGSAMFREIIYHESRKSVVVSTAFYFLLVAGFFFYGTLYCLSFKISQWIFATSEYSNLLQIVFITNFLEVGKVIFLAKLRIEQRSKQYAFLNVLVFLFGASVNIYFIAFLKLGLRGFILANFITGVVFAFVYFLLIKEDLKGSFSTSILGRMLSFGIPLIPSGLVSIMMTSADRYFLKYFSTNTEVGLYSVGYKIGLIMNLMVQAFQLIWAAEKFDIAKKPDSQEYFAKILTYYLFVTGFVGLFLSVLSPEILLIMTTPAFFGAYIVIPLISLSYIFYGMKFITNIGLAVLNKMKYVPPIIIGAGLLNLILNYILIPHYGMMGAAVATVISYFVLIIVQTAINLHFWFIAYEYKRILKIFLVCCIIYFSSRLLQMPNIWMKLWIKLIMLLTYPFMLYIIKFYDEKELISIKKGFLSAFKKLQFRRTH